MQEIITNSGAVIRTSAAEGSFHRARINEAIELLGGAAIIAEADERRDTVLTIMDQNIVGTTLTDSDGTVYTLTNEGWYYDKDGDEGLIKLPPFETITSATMPGGWAWTL